MSMTEAEFWAALAPVDPRPIFYRLYHHDDGTPICYSMEELPHNYIELTAEQYHQSPPNVRVVDGQMVVVKPANIVKQLVPGSEGIPCHPNDICIVVNEAEPHTKWSIKTNETS